MAVRRVLSGILLVMLALCWLACRGTSGDTRRASEQAVDMSDNQVAAYVGMSRVSLAELKHLVQDLGADIKTMLTRLERERLLYLHARTLGIHRRAALTHAFDQALVRAWLKTAFEPKVPRAGRDELEGRYEKEKTRFHQDERRGAQHVLIMVPKNADKALDDKARALAQSAIDAFRTTQPSIAVVERYADLRQLDGMMVRAEEVPLLPRTARADENYLNAIFSAKAPGVIETPVRTQFGWHAVNVTRIVPEENRSFDDALSTLEHEEWVRRSERMLIESLKTLRKQANVELDVAGTRYLYSEAFSKGIDAP